MKNFTYEGALARVQKALIKAGHSATIKRANERSTSLIVDQVTLQVEERTSRGLLPSVVILLLRAHPAASQRFIVTCKSQIPVKDIERLIDRRRDFDSYNEALRLADEELQGLVATFGHLLTARVERPSRGTSRLPCINLAITLRLASTKGLRAALKAIEAVVAQPGNSAVKQENNSWI